MVHIGKDGYGVGFASMGQHSLDKVKLNDYVSKLNFWFNYSPERRPSSSDQLREIISDNWPDLSRAEQNYMIIQLTK